MGKIILVQETNFGGSSAICSMYTPWKFAPVNKLKNIPKCYVIL